MVISSAHSIYWLRESIWFDQQGGHVKRCVKRYGVPKQIVILTQETYRGYVCRVVHEGQVSEPISVQTRVRQSCILSPTMFLIMIDAVMRNVNWDRWRGIQWSLVNRLEDLDFADDLCLLSATHGNIQMKLEDLTNKAEKTGPIINVKKTKALRINTSKTDSFTLRGESIEDVDSFTYLGSVVAEDGVAVQDVSQRIRKANGAFVQLYPVWKNNRISTRTKLCIFCSNVKSVLLYGSETRKEMKTTASKLQIFVNRCLWWILNIHWLEMISNKELWRRTGEIEMSMQIRRQKWNWIGHTLRKGHEAIEREALDWNPQVKRRRGRSRHTWRRTVHNQPLEKVKSWSEVKRMTGNRTRWRCFVDALCPLRNNRNW